MGLRLHLQPMSALCRRVSLYSSPPGERLVAAVLGPFALQPPLPAVRCACSVHSLGLPPVVLSLDGRPRRAGLAGSWPLCPPTVSSSLWAIAWAAWLLTSVLLACVTAGPSGRGSLSGEGGVSTGEIWEPACGLALCTGEEPGSQRGDCVSFFPSREERLVPGRPSGDVEG